MKYKYIDKKAYFKKFMLHKIRKCFTIKIKIHATTIRAHKRAFNLW